ncbi:MAG: UDP-N-acetylmuramate dehydrogenase [Saprospiraceae bacterium]|nr:UDP-N-acetylmuramate dehydrogenase [Saprospiraceae bacterium]
MQSINLKAYNSFGISAFCKILYFIRHENELIDLYGKPRNEFYILGEGSNILLSQDIERIILKNEIKGIEIIHDEKDYVTVKVGGGENWHEFVLWSLLQGYSGIENLSLIPGTVGAAPVQNIGAYGVEQDEAFVRLEGVDIYTGKTLVMNKKACEFQYRDSIFKNNLKGSFFITRVHYRLNKNFTPKLDYGDIKKILEEDKVTEPGPVDVSNAVIKIRQSKLPDPKLLGNAGSFFKNPIIEFDKFLQLSEKFPLLPKYYIDESHVKIPAAWMIENCGWKGKRIADVGCHEKQALVLVNYGNGTGKEINELADMVISSVNDTFGIILEKEVNIWY